MNADSSDTLTESTTLPGSLAAWLASQPAQAEIGNPPARTDEASRILQAAAAILAQGELLLQALATEHYAQKVPAAFNASIGGHYRHCLDHFTSVLRSLGNDLVDYDHRERDGRLETQPECALDVTRQLRRTLAGVSPSQLYHAVAARCEISYDPGHSPVTASSLGRELVCCISHTIHHYALIAIMARLLGVQLPEHFGIAPSTAAHQRVAAA